MELDIMWKSRIENKVLLRQMGAGLVDTKRVLINNGKIKKRNNSPVGDHLRQSSDSNPGPCDSGQGSEPLDQTANIPSRKACTSKAQSETLQMYIPM